jgi:hypothetical protein
VCHPSSPRGQGTAPSFYKPRGGGLQSCRTVLITCGGMVYNAVEWMAVLANLAPVGRHGKSCSPQEWLRGRLSGDFPFGRRPYADSRVRLTGGRKVHNNGHGDVLSSRVPTTSGMVLQCPRWLHSGGDGRTGPEVTGETHSTGLMSRRCPAWARGRCPYPFRGFRRPLSRVQRAGRTGVGGTVSRS